MPYWPPPRTSTLGNQRAVAHADAGRRAARPAGRRSSARRRRRPPGAAATSASSLRMTSAMRVGLVAAIDAADALVDVVAEDAQLHGAAPVAGGRLPAARRRGSRHRRAAGRRGAPRRSAWTGRGQRPGVERCAVEPAQHALQPAIAERLPSRILRLDHTIGIPDDEIAGSQRFAAGLSERRRAGHRAGFRVRRAPAARPRSLGTTRGTGVV